MILTIIAFIRTVLFYLVFASFTVVWCSSIPFLNPFLPAGSQHRVWARCWAIIVLQLAKVICGIRYNIQGQENIPDSPCVIVSNHQSTWETICFQTLFSPQSQVVKRELLAIPFFGWALRLMHPIAIDRSSPKSALADVIKQGKSVLKKGRWVLIFPEGTRNSSGKLGNFSRGGALLACKASVDVLPVAHNAAKCWPMTTFLKRAGTIEVAIGPTISSKDRSPASITNETREWIVSSLDSMKKTAKN